ncbi:hypothetical protein [Pectobacterium cacticida]|uniref:hypothetical protein n=1 Tax=Pectobacterium cacticida TaxID=69221 RepID=UPI0039860D4B
MSQMFAIEKLAITVDRVKPDRPSQQKSVLPNQATTSQVSESGATQTLMTSTISTARCGHRMPGGVGGGSSQELPPIPIESAFFINKVFTGKMKVVQVRLA